MAVRELADQAFSRASGAPLREGNGIELLRDGAQNYPAWLAAIATARVFIHLEMYIVMEDEQGRVFSDAFIAKAREGVRVRVLYDWLGGFRKTSGRFWRRLREAGVEVCCYNRPRLDEPLGWLSRDHRKVLIVDGEEAFVTGLCIGRQWMGDSIRGVDPWRDTGIALRGPAVADLEAAFADSWAAAGGSPMSKDTRSAAKPEAGNVALRVVATVPNTASVFRVDQLVAAMARDTLWLTDAYFGGTAAYVQALRAAAADGVDVRLLVPGESDIPIVRTFSRAGYRSLLEAGVRVYEWNGSMLHAKTAVADARWARVGSTNLNIASWMGNRELDVVVEDTGFARQMQEMFLEDLERSTEVVVDARHRIRRPPSAPRRRRGRSRRGGSGGRIVAGAFRVGDAVTAAIMNRRVLEPIEAHLALIAAALLMASSVLAALWPKAVIYPLAAIGVWFALALLFRGVVLLRARRQSPPPR